MLKVIRYILGVTFYFILTTTFVFGQVSSGGFPLQVNTAKSVRDQIVQLPKLAPSKIEEAHNQNKLNGGLKPFRFAVPVEVAYDPQNSGQWYSTNAGFNVWRLTLKSAGAKSLNVIFDRFQLSNGARLYLFNEKENHYLGAFTILNNKASLKFAVSPVLGEEITIQYEVPERLGTPNDFEIVRVNHDFIGVLKSDRRPLGIAGDCNVDVNCSLGEDYLELKNSVCRLIVDGVEFCSGTLLNNTAEDGKPYVLSAWHCYDEWELAETTVYTFNYESPYCAPLDGDPLHSISGAVMKAHYDSLDLALVEMTLVPPPDYRPYYAGWNHSGSLPDSSVSIHHPYADIKKIAFDNDAPSYATFTSSSVKNPNKGSFKIERWDDGVTEIGSSGGGLFNTKKQLIGTLSGGAAICGNPVNDYYARFDKQWDFKSDSSQQLKYWLDPLDSGLPTLDGKQFYTAEDLCKAFTNLNDDDEHAKVSLTINGSFEGYWGGTNNVGIDEIVERFSISGNETLRGVSFGVATADHKGGRASEITVKVYNGVWLPEKLIYSKTLNIDDLAEDAMNYIAFDQDVQPSETFFIGFELSNMQPLDTFVLYQSLRDAGDENNFYFRLNGEWTNFESNNDGALANVMELVACNYDNYIDTPVVDTPANVWIYPNPTQAELSLQSDQEISVETISVFNLIGQEINAPLISVGEFEVKLDLSGNTPGVYVVRFNYDGSFVTRKFSLVPY
mgnify:CR=1 FL=1